MTTAYTPILKLALPVTGELNGTWGDVVNNNITSMVEQAVAGLATINTWTANSHTLTTADGTTSESRCAMLVIDDDGAGNPSAAATVVCPTATKAYIVQNLCGQTVTVKTAAGTGVAVPNNQSALVFCNGTNVVTGAFNGDVVGPATATNNAIVTFDGTTGKLIKDNSGATISAGVITATGVSTGQVDITAQGDLRLQDTTGGQYVALQAPGTIATSYTLTLPVDDGTAGQALITDGSGVLSWSSAASGDVYGPASATDNAVARYDGTTGKIIQNSAVTIGDDGATVIAANSSSDGLRITQTGAGNALLIEDSANPDATPTVFDNNGNLILGSTTLATTPSTFYSTIQSHSSANQSLGIGLFNYSTGVAARGDVAFYKSLSGTNGTLSAVSTNTDIGSLNFFGAGDASTWLRAGIILAEVDTGTVSATSMPGRLVFATTADGASSPTERMRIDSAGRVGIGGTATTGEMVAIRNTAETTATVFGLRNLASINQATTTTAYGISDQTQILSPAALTNLFRFRAASGGFTGTVTNQYGYAADSGLTGATNNYGFHSNIASGAGRFNFFAAGTAANVFVGTTSIGGNPGAESFRVTPVSSSVNYLNVQGAITTASPSITAAGSDTNIDLRLITTGTGVLSFGTYTAGVVAQAGYITIKDAGGATRRLLVG